MRVPAIGAAVVALLLLLWSIVPFENSEPATGAEQTLFSVLLLAAVAASALALASAYWIAHDRLTRARAAYVAHLGIAIAFVAWGLSESHHSDGVLLAFGAGIELAGVLSMLLLVGRNRPEELVD